MLRDILKRGRNAVLIGAMALSPFMVHARADERTGTQEEEAIIENIAEEGISLSEGKELTDRRTGINVIGHEYGGQESELTEIPESGNENHGQGAPPQTDEGIRTLLPSFPDGHGFGRTRHGTDYARFYQNRASIDLGLGYFYEHGEFWPREDYLYLYLKNLRLV